MKAAKAVWTLAAIAFLAWAAAMPAQAQSPPAAQPAAPAPAQTAKVAPVPAKQFIVPSGTHIPLVMENSISTKTARPGDPIYFLTTFPVVIDNRIVMPAGTYVSGEVLEARRPGRVKGRAELLLKLNWMILSNGYSVNLAASPTNAGTGGDESVTKEGGKEGEIKGSGDVAHDAGVLVRTTAIGGGIGAAAGGVKGAGIGLGAGAAIGLLAVLLTRGPDAELPRGTTLDVVLDRPIALDASRINFTTPGQAPDLSGAPNRKRRRSSFPF
jgi:hypothetical protein